MRAPDGLLFRVSATQRLQRVEPAAAKPILHPAALKAQRAEERQATEPPTNLHAPIVRAVEPAAGKPVERPASAEPPDTLTITEPIHMELVRVPAGKFLMGDEKNAVTVDEFYIGKYPVTNAQYAAFAKATGRKDAITGKDDHPVVNVSWDDAVAFAEWLSVQTGKLFRLPTEAEWEKAARGMDGRIYPWGDAGDPKKANTSEGGPGGTTPVGQYSPGGDSPYGCADMAGNVWEWTSSLYRPYPYEPGDGREDLKAGGARVLRGGAYYDDPGGVRCACRFRDLPDYGSGDIGFRVVASP